MAHKFKVKIAGEDKSEWVHLNNFGIQVDDSNVDYDGYGSLLRSPRFSCLNLNCEYQLDGEFCNLIHNLMINSSRLKYEFHIKMEGSNSEIIFKQGAIRSFSSYSMDGDNYYRNYGDSHVTADIDVIYNNETSSINSASKLKEPEKICWKKYGF